MTAPMKVAFYKGRTRLFNRLVSWWLRGPYSHCELVVWSTEGGYSLCISSSFMDGGVRAKWMALDPEHWDLLPAPAHCTEEYALQWHADHDGARYDVWGLVGFLWRRVTGDRRKFFCSEAVAEMLGFAEAWRLDPMNFWVALAGATPSPKTETTFPTLEPA